MNIESPETVLLVVASGLVLPSIVGFVVCKIRLRIAKTKEREKRKEIDLLLAMEKPPQE